MKPEELRIGNWVKYRGEPAKVEQLRVNCLGIANSDVLVDYNEIEPIELTEEVLLKVGFDKYDEDMNIYAFESGRAVVVYVLNRKLLRIEGVENDVLIDRNIRLNNVEHLHQLQSAYYLLTNEELKIEL